MLAKLGLRGNTTKAKGESSDKAKASQALMPPIIGWGMENLIVVSPLIALTIFLLEKKRT